MNQRNADVPPTTGVGGWLLVLCVLLVVWEPAGQALRTSRLLTALADRGIAVTLIALLRLLVTGIGMVAGVALWTRKPHAVVMAKVSLVLSAILSVFVLAAPILPSYRAPGATLPLVLLSITYHAAWYGYLARSSRVRSTFGDPRGGSTRPSVLGVEPGSWPVPSQAAGTTATGEDETKT